jgi:hypothetical protein
MRLEFALTVTVAGVLAAGVLHALSVAQARSREARLLATVQQVRAAASLFHARCQLQPPASATDPCATLALGSRMARGVHGWPSASTQGIVAAAALPLHPQDPHGFVVTPLADRAVPSIAIGLPASTADRCRLVYAQAAQAGAQPTVDAPLFPSCD